MKTLNQSRRKFFATPVGSLLALALLVPGSGTLVWLLCRLARHFSLVTWSVEGCKDLGVLTAIVGLCIFLVLFNKDEDEGNDLKFN